MRFIFTLVFIAWGFLLRAQELLTVDMLVPDKAIKVSPLHLINFYPTIEVSYEQKIIDRITAQFELGYVVNYNVNHNRDFQNKRGVKTKLEARYYFWGRTDRHKLYYASAEPYYNSVNFDREDSRQECFDLECNHIYRKEYNYTVEYREQGLSLKMGMLRYFSKNIFFDLNSGFTLRVVNYKKPNLVPEFSEDTIQFFDIPNENDRVTVSPHFGIRMGYRIK